MCQTFDSLSHLSREELYSLVNALKRQINCLSTDLLGYELLSKKCENYSKVLQNSHQFNAELTEDIVDLVAINDIQCYVDCGPRVESISGRDYESDANNEDPIECHFTATSEDISVDNQMNDESIKSDGHELSAEDVNDSDVSIDCEVGYESEDEIMSEKSGANEDSTHDSVTSLKTTHDINRWAQEVLKECDINRQTMDETVGRTGAENSYQSMDDSNRKRDSRGKRRAKTSRNLLNDANSESTNGQTVHSGERFFCDYKNCCKHFSHWINLFSHKRSGAHVFGQPYRCCVNRCHFETASKEALVDHMATGHKTRVHLDVSGHCDTIDETMDETIDATVIEVGDDSMDDSSEPQESIGSRLTKWRLKTSSNPMNGSRNATPDVKGQYACDYDGCDKRYDNARLLEAHRTAHTGRRFFCDYKTCRKHFTYESALKRHKKFGDHRFARDYLCAVGHCQFSTQSIHVLQEHVMDEHRSRRCPVNSCRKGFKSVRNLDEHVVSAHPMPMPVHSVRND